MTQVCRLCFKLTDKQFSFEFCNDAGLPAINLLKLLVPELFVKRIESHLCYQTCITKLLRCLQTAVCINSTDGSIVSATTTRWRQAEKDLKFAYIQYLGLSLNPVICQPCYDALRDAYSFRLQCLRSENLISIYMRETRCSSMTIVLQDVIDYWMDVYKNKQCQTAVARANLEDWFGLDTSHIRPDNKKSYCKRKTSSSKTTDKKRTARQGGQPEDPLASTVQSEGISSRDLIELLLGNYRVEIEKLESDNDEEKSAKNRASANETKTDETPNTSLACVQDVSDRETCECPQTLDENGDEESHDDCVILGEYRHLEQCKYFRTQTTEKIGLVRKNNHVNEEEQIPTAATPPETTVDEITEKPIKGDVRAPASVVFIDDIDEDNLFEELQKCYNAGKFGFSEDFSNLKECFVLKKFFDETDNSFSYALLPKATGDGPEGLSKTSSVERTEPSSSLSDAYLVFKSRDLIDGEKPEENSQISSDSVSQSEGGEMKNICGDLNNDALVGPSQAKAMPVIRVRPVSTLQKVRTLNHELFPLPEAERAREATPAGPRTVAMQPVRHTPVMKSGAAPVVLNATIVSSLKNVLVPIKCPSPPPPNESLKTVKKTYSKPAKGAQTRIWAKLKSGVENDKEGRMPVELVHHVNAGKITEVALTTSEGSGAVAAVGKNNAEPSANEEEVIDIKEEPLDYVEDEFSNELQVGEGLINVAECSGETTRSSSETSLMEKFMSDNISQLIENIPDIGQEFDEPEYVHINKVSFSDITKLVRESKQMKQQLKEKIENHKLVDPLQVSDTSRRRGRLWKVGKRVRIVPVNVDETELPLRKRQRTLVKTVERTVSDPNCDNKDVCVLFTNFTSEGDYINDHDYLINPYMRNNMSIVRKSGTLNCACLLCNVIHPAKEHIRHMKCHGTKCAICEIDFHNVFILNLHARAHVSFCKLCHVTVTYSRYLHHTVNHNRLVEQAQLVDAKKSMAGSTSKPLRKRGRNPNSPRRGRRTRAKNLKEMELDEEEACIYDKATKSFVTPSVVKQEKLLEEQCNDTSKKSENTTKPPSADDEEAALKFVNLADLEPNTANINVNLAGKSAPQSEAPKNTKLLYSGGRRRKYQKNKRAVRSAKTREYPEKTEADESEESGGTGRKRKKLVSENECDEIKDDLLLEASISRRLSLRRRCPEIVPKNSSNLVPSIRQRRKRTKKLHHQKQDLSQTSESTASSDLATAVDAIIGFPTVDQSKIGSGDEKLERDCLESAEETSSSKCHENPKLETPSSSVPTGTRSSRSRRNANLFAEGTEVRRLAKSKKAARKSLSQSGNNKKIGENEDQPEPSSSATPGAQSPSASLSSDPCDSKPEKDGLERVDVDQCGGETNCA